MPGLRCQAGGYGGNKVVDFQILCGYHLEFGLLQPRLGIPWRAVLLQLRRLLPDYLAIHYSILELFKQSRRGRQLPFPDQLVFAAVRLCVWRPTATKGIHVQFSDFSFHELIRKNIENAGYTSPTPVQAQAMPAVLAGRDVMGLAQTGTGKTAAFVLPILQNLMQRPPKQRSGARVLVLAPTRELAEQIHQTCIDLGKHTGIRSLTVYGGVGMGPQINGLRRGPSIIVACPGRLLDHMNRGTVDLSKLETLVLDEADHMFDMGFLPDLRRIMDQLPAKRQNLLFSATMPASIMSLAKDILNDPETISIDASAPAKTVTHEVYPVSQNQKTSLLKAILHSVQGGSVLVFTRTKHQAKKLAQQLDNAGQRATSLQGNLSQARRREAMQGFRTGGFRVLVATDIAARGIDVSRVDHVINYDLPDTPEAYTHRIGRTGRAERTGRAYSLITRGDGSMVRAIERLLGSKLQRRTLEGFEYASAETDPRSFADGKQPGRGPSGKYAGKPKRDFRGKGAAKSGGNRPDSGRRPAKAAAM